MSDELQQLESFLTTIINSIVSKPEEVKLNFTDEDTEEKGEMTIINIKVATEDIPLCIGTGGSTADSIRRLTVLASRKIGYTRNIFLRIDAPKMPKNHFEFNH
jgi:predicted RNA-binding protein YlqC (UPF0109 family)